MQHLGLESSKDGSNVSMRHSVHKDGTAKYWGYVLSYTDDCLVISNRADAVLREEIGKYFDLKEESIGSPSQYLGGN